MIILRDFNQEKKLDRVWYESSNIFYSECEDIPNELKVLRVVFKNGSAYEYHDVDVNDYVMFLKGGLDGSNGKALNEFIKKKKCPYTKIDTLKKEELEEEMKQIKEERLRIIKEDAEKHLMNQVNDAIKNGNTTNE